MLNFQIKLLRGEEGRKLPRAGESMVSWAAKRGLVAKAVCPLYLYLKKCRTRRQLHRESSGIVRGQGHPLQPCRWEAVARFWKHKSLMFLSFPCSCVTSALDVNMPTNGMSLLFLFLVSSSKLKPLELERKKKKNTSKGCLALALSPI